MSHRNGMIPLPSAESKANRLHCPKCEDTLTPFHCGFVSDLKAHLAVHARLHNPPTHLYYFVLKRCINNGIQMPQSIDFDVPFFALAYADWVEYEKTSCANNPCMDCINKDMYRNMTEKHKMESMKRGEYRGYVQQKDGSKVFIK